MKVLLTGANGFVGRVLGDFFSREDVSVLAVTRREQITFPGEVLQLADIVAYPYWHQQLQDIDVVVHLAATVHVMQGASVDDYRSVNIDASCELALAARASKVKRFVFISTVKVNGENTLAGEKFCADDEPAPDDDYARSKCQAEQSLQSIFQGSTTELVIIRPPLVYGPGVGANFARLLKLAKLPLPLPFLAINNRRDMVSVLNLCDFIMLCCQHPAAPGRVWMVADAHAYSLPEMIKAIRLLNGRSPRLFYFPVSLMRLLLAMLNKSGLSSRLFDGLEVDSSPAEKILGWTPPYTLSQTLREVVSPDE